jgi:hypothetical protein
MSSNISIANALIELLGQSVAAPEVQASLAKFARGMQPELDADDEDCLVDWVTVNEIGLEYGFEDAAYVQALEVNQRRNGELLLTQLYFYGDTPTTQPFPHPLPLGLSFEDDRPAVREKLAAHEGTRRSYLRDAWQLPNFNLTVAYAKNSGRLESVFCHVAPTPWSLAKGEAELAAAFNTEVFVGLFGRRWSHPTLRAQLAPLGFEDALRDVRSEHTAYLHVEHGIELGFAPSQDIAGADSKYPKSLALASVTFYASRVLDARAWQGPLPLDISFDDTFEALAAKLMRAPDERADENQTGFVLWHFKNYSLQIEYSSVENRLLKITMLAAGFWAASNTDE